MSKDKGRKWDGKSRVSNDKYRKRFDEITWRNMDEIAAEISKDANAWIKGYRKWKKQGIISDKVKLKDLKKINLNEKYNAKKDFDKLSKEKVMEGEDPFQKEKEELNESYQQSLNNKKERQKNDE